jgi:protein phosphatase
MIRAGNEDSFFAEANDKRGLFIVADGMGGHAAGEVASEMAVQIISRELAGITELNGDNVAAKVSDAVKKANSKIYERTITEVDKQGMGTTASVLILTGSRYLI